MIHNDADNPNYDVVITGGALAGASAAILLKREQPNLRVLIIERSPAFRRRVGEATVEISGYFLTRVLGLTQYLNQNHLIKQGFRFWMADDQTRELGDCSEIGAKYQTRVPSFLIDRAELDEEVLRRAEALGVEVWRPAQVQSIVLLEGGMQTLQVRRGGRGAEPTMLRSRWVIDASGVAAHLARQNQWVRPNIDHPTTAVWARWTGVGDWDDPKLAERYPDWNRNFFGIRGTATNHFMGDGWWAWFIRLKNGDVSIGVLYDQRLVDWSTEEHGLAAQLKTFISRHPAAKHMLEHATVVENDVHLRRNLAWVSDVFAGDGFALVSDAAGFLDPFYSPGLDWLTFTVSASTRLILDSYQKPDLLKQKIEQHNAGFSRAYEGLVPRTLQRQIHLPR